MIFEIGFLTVNINYNPVPWFVKTRTNLKLNWFLAVALVYLSVLLLTALLVDVLKIPISHRFLATSADQEA